MSYELPQRKGTFSPPQTVPATRPATSMFPGRRVVSEGEQVDRLAHCYICDKNAAGNCSLCRTCGGRSVKSKVKMNTEFCPLGKWGKIAY